MNEYPGASGRPDPWSTGDADFSREEDFQIEEDLGGYLMTRQEGTLRISTRCESTLKKIVLFEYLSQSDYVSLFPRNRGGEHAYGKLKEIRVDLNCLDSWDAAKPVAESGFGRLDEVRRIYIKSLPDGLGRVLDFGLTLPPSERRIIYSIQDLSPATTVLHICDDYERSSDPEVFQISYRDWLNLVNGFDLTSNRARSVAARVNDHATDTFVRRRLDLAPRELSMGRLDVVQRMTPVIAGQTELDKSLATRLLDSVSSEAAAAAKLSPKKFAKLSAQLDLVSLDTLIDLFAARLQQDLDEKDWQRFFDNNRFALQQIFSAPLALVAREAVTRFPGVTGQGAQFTDFLLANTITKTAHLVEIKTPKAKLLDKKYRGRGRASIFPPHRELAGGVAQLQAQVASARVTLGPALLQDGKNPSDLNTTVIYGALIAGTLTDASPEDRESFLRYRWGLSNIIILTYDEVLERLRDLRDFLKLPSEVRL